MLFSLSDFRRWFPYEMAWWNRTIFDKIFMDIYFLQLQKCTIDIIKYIYNRNSRFWFSFLKRKKKKKLYISTTIIISWIAQKHQIRRNTVLSFTNVVCIKIDTLTINSLSIYPILAGLSRAQSLTSGYTGWWDFNGKSEFTKRESCGPHLLTEFTFTRLCSLMRHCFRANAFALCNCNQRPIWTNTLFSKGFVPRWSIAIFEAHRYFDEQQLAIMPRVPRISWVSQVSNSTRNS